jgi:hypothetical protein
MNWGEERGWLKTAKLHKAILFYMNCALSLNHSSHLIYVEVEDGISCEYQAIVVDLACPSYTYDGYHFCTRRNAM